MRLNLSRQQAYNCRDEAVNGRLRYGLSQLGDCLNDEYRDPGAATEVWRVGARDGDIECMRDLGFYGMKAATVEAMKEGWYWLTEITNAYEHRVPVSEQQYKPGFMRTPTKEIAGQTYFFLGCIAKEQNNQADAQRYWVKSSELGYPDGFYALGLREYLRDNYDAAAEYLGKAVELRYLPAYLLLGYTNLYKYWAPEMPVEAREQTHQLLYAAWLYMRSPRAAYGIWVLRSLCAGSFSVSEMSEARDLLDIAATDGYVPAIRQEIKLAGEDFRARRQWEEALATALETEEQEHSSADHSPSLISARRNRDEP